jgi:predicted DNA-binding ribbon-helix-helix protein
MNGVTGQLTTRVVESPAKARSRTGLSKTARLQQAFTAHLSDIARAYPASLRKPVLITIDNTPWHQAASSTQVLAASPYLQHYRLLSYSPQLNLIEPFWRVLRRRATQDRLFASMRELKTALRASFCYFPPCVTRCGPWSTARVSKKKQN